MTTLFIILIILVSVVLAFFVLIQNPKGGGLSSGFAGGSNLMGVQRTGDFLEKGTWVLVISLMVFSLAINIIGSGSGVNSGALSDQIEAPVQAPVLNLNNSSQSEQETAPISSGADSVK